jgi:hypothetical protein
VSGTDLTTYLNDHLAGSVAALELLDYLTTLEPGANRALFTELRADIEQDQQVLKRLLDTLGGKQSQVRKAAAWLAEKLGQAKLQLDDSGTGDLRRLEALETLALGIQGKLALWRSLASIAGRVPQLASVDLQTLQQRATDQFARVDPLRLQAAQAALLPEA